MLHKSILRHCLAGLLLLCGGLQLHAQGTAFSPFKLTLFEDAAQLASKGIVSFTAQRADLPMEMPMVTPLMDIVPGVADVHLRYFKMRVDSVAIDQSVGTWSEVLLANMGKKLTIVYAAGMELDEVSGTTKLVNTEQGMLLLHGGDESEYFIPLAEIKQVIVQGQGNFKSLVKVPRTILELGIDKDQPFVPMQMYSVHTGMRWTPVGRIRLLNSEKALLQLTAVIENDFADLHDIDLELSASKILSEGHQNGEAVTAGKLSLKKGERLAMGLSETELAYVAAYQCQIPWDDKQADGRLHRFPVQHIIRFDATTMPALSPDSYHVIDENNRQLAQIGLYQGANKQLELNLGEEAAVHVNLLEQEVKRSAKVERIGELDFQRVTIKGKVVCQNAGPKFIQIQVQRDIKGQLIEGDKAKVDNSPDEPGIQNLVWKFSLDRGAKREVNYSYDAFVPAIQK